MQEALPFQLRSISARLRGYNFTGHGRDGENRGEHCAIFYDQNTLSLKNSITQWYGKAPGQPTILPGAKKHRIFTKATLELVNKQQIDIYNTHLDEKQNDLREISFQQLVSTINPNTPTIILGDFNARRNNKIFSDVNKFGLRFAHDKNIGGTSHGFSRTDAKEAIDHVLISDHFSVVSAQVIRKRKYFMLPSDHWPVTAELMLK